VSEDDDNDKMKMEGAKYILQPVLFK